MSSGKRIILFASLIIVNLNIVFAADWKESAKAIDISGGEDHTLVLTANKSPWACGPNGGSGYSGVLGTGSGSSSLAEKTLVRVWDGDMNTPSDYLENIADLEAGWKHSLALDVNAFVWSWGNNFWGQLGVGEGTPARSTPIQVLRGDQADDPCQPSDYLKHIIDISAGRSGEHSLAVDANGYAYAWGMNVFGQCGNGVFGYDEKELVPVRVLAGEQDASDPNSPLEQIIAVSAGEWHSMALEKYDPADANFEGCVYTWGDDSYYPEGEERGILGTGGTGEISAVRPVRVWAGEQDYNEPNHIYLKHIVAISAGWDHSMALEKYEVYDPFEPNYDPNHKGRVYTWGDNEASSQSFYGGRLGNGTTTSSSTPVVVRRGRQEPEDPCNQDPNLTRIIAISAGEGHSMALDVDGYVYTWGSNYYGQLGDGSIDPCTTPVRVVGEDRNRNGIHEPNEGYLENIVAISAGYWHSLAIDANGAIWTWGNASAGRLGLGNMANASPYYISIPHRIPVVYNVTQNTFAFAIQTAIGDANGANDVLEASPGTYYEDVDFLTKTITLRSADPNNAEVVEDTVIQGSGGWYIPAVQFTSNNDSSLSGFTIVNGHYGIRCNSSSPTISNSVIANCGGHGLYCVGNSAVEMTNCTISANGGSVSPVENGISCSTSEIILSNCLIADNAGDGIYSYQSTPAIANCIIEKNAGHGVYNQNSSSASITNSIIHGNDDHGIYSSTGTEIQIKNN